MHSPCNFTTTLTYTAQCKGSTSTRSGPIFLTWKSNPLLTTNYATGKFSFHLYLLPSTPSPSWPTNWLPSSYHSLFQTCNFSLTFSNTHSQTTKASFLCGELTQITKEGVNGGEGPNKWCTVIEVISIKLEGFEVEEDGWCEWSKQWVIVAVGIGKVLASSNIECNVLMANGV